MDLEQRKQEMYQLVEQWQASGQSRTAWCRENNLSRSTFRNWWQKYQEEYGLTETTKPVTLTDEPSFVPIDVAGRHSDQLLITYPNGVQVNCPSGISHGQLRKLVMLFG